MFYNGCRAYMYVYVFYEFLFSTFHNITTSRLMITSTHLQLNDGNVFLNIIASPTYSILFLFVCTSVYVVNLLSISHNIIFLIIMSQSYFYRIFDITTTVSNAFSSTPLTLTLQNGLLNIHPYIIYIVYGYMLIYIIYSIISNTIYTSTLAKSELKYTLMLWVLFSITLGAWWAAQEFNWGGFWSWDPVELISLLLWFFMVYLAHQSSTIYKYKVISWYIFAILIVYLVMRLGIINTIHSFIRGSTVTIYMYVLFFSGFVTTTILLLYYTHIMSKFIHLTSFNITYYFIICITLLLIVFTILLTNGLLNKQISDTLALDTLYRVSVFALLSWLVVNNGSFLISGLYVGAWAILCSSLNLFMVCVSTVFIKRIFKFENWILHILILWVYILGILFFVAVYTYYTNYSIYTNNFNVTDYYMYNVIDNLTLSNTDLFSKFFMLLSKGVTTVLPGFFTHSNIVISEFLTGRGSTLVVTYVQNYIYMCVYVLFCLVILLFSRVYTTHVDYY